MEWGEVLSIVLTVSTIAGGAAMGLLRGTVTNLREQLRDERDRSNSLIQQRTEDRATIDQLKTDLTALGRVVTAEAHWIAVGQQLDQHHDEARAHWHAEKDLLREVRDILKGFV